MEMILRIIMIIAVCAKIEAESNLPECAEQLISYAYTECDSSNGRWRVAVPTNDRCVLKNPAPPVRGKDCDFSCKQGEYLDLNSQKCRQCPLGTYSLGNGVRFETWNEIPPGFMLSSNAVSFAEYGYHSKVGNCSASVWKPQKDYIRSNDDDCSSSLSYSCDVKSKGSVSFTYQFADDDIIFHFYIQNAECQNINKKGKNVFLNTTGTSWKMYSVDLDPGINVLYWKTTGILLSNKQKVSPVLIKDIQVTGVSFTTHCRKCTEGFYANSEASHRCKPCPENTMSGPGESQCHSCDTKTQYAPPGSASCIERPSCTEKDYFETFGPCDTNKTTEVMYAWKQPTICNKNSSQSVKLPSSGSVKDCSPCNPGYHETEDGKCDPCVDQLYSDGTQDCHQCPAGTSPVYGFMYLWWDELPPNMDISCLTVHADKCSGKTGWQPSGSKIESSQGESGNAYLVLVFHVDGFRDSISEVDSIRVYGTVTFAFELQCSGNCVLYFMKEVHGSGTTVINSWHAKKDKKVYSYHVTQNRAVTFTWAFQKTSENSESNHALVEKDKAIIYLINVTNALGSPVADCHPCATGTYSDKCISCPAGNYVTPSGDCELCPEGTFMGKNNPNASLCTKCPSGTFSNSMRTACQNDCTFKSGGRMYNFSAFETNQIVHTPPSFTSSGRKYIHYYNISLCGNDGLGTSQCIDNVSISNYDRSDEPMKKVVSMVCRSTKLASIGSNGDELVVFSKPLSVATSISSVFLDSFNSSSVEDIFPASPKSKLEDIVYVLKSGVSQECPGGVEVSIHLRCDPAVQGKLEIDLPSKCPDGTCDGCTFHFLWRSLEACPLCTPDDYSTFTSSCTDGFITTKYIWNSYPKKCWGGVKLPAYIKSDCVDLKFYIEIGVICGTVLLFILCITLYCLWKKSKKLEYKYQKLVMTSNKTGGELPAADSCALSESESDECGDINEEVRFQKKRAKILGKKKGNNYESVSLKTLNQSL